MFGRVRKAIRVLNFIGYVTHTGDGNKEVRIDLETATDGVGAFQ